MVAEEFPATMSKIGSKPNLKFILESHIERIAGNPEVVSSIDEIRRHHSLTPIARQTDCVVGEMRLEACKAARHAPLTYYSVYAYRSGHRVWPSTETFDGFMHLT